MPNRAKLREDTAVSAAAAASEVRGTHQARDLAALLALQGMWRGRDLPYIAATLLDSLVSLLRLDVAYIRLDDPNGGPPLEERRPLSKLSPAEVGDALLGRGELHAQGSVADPIGQRQLRVIRHVARLDREAGLVIGGSPRPDFPTDVESFLFRTAVEQGMIALQGARLLRDLQEANNAKSTFLATMSHELRTPLNAILGYVDLLDAEIAGPLTEQQKLNLSRVSAGARHLMQLIDGILTFARIEAGKEEVYHTAVDAAELARESAALLEPLIRGKGLEFVVRVPAGPLVLHTDAGKLRQILLNLLSNAAKFTGSGRITLELQAAADSVAFVVSDTGIGIHPSELGNIFEPFRQVGHVYTKTSSGTGLGLSVSRQLAILLDGAISVASEPGVGSTFRVTLPRSGAAT